MTEHSSPERADFFDASHGAFFGDHASRYDFASHFVRGKRVIDAACGSGYGSARLIQAGASTCVGIDISADRVTMNSRLYGAQGIQFVHGNCEIHDLKQYSPDVIVSFETIEHIQNPLSFLEKVRTGLDQNGLFIVSCPNNEKLGENPYHLHAWDSQSFSNLLKAHFDDVVLLGQVVTPSARVHHEFGRYLDNRIGIMWNQPWTRLWRALRVALGRPAELNRPQWADFVPGPNDWWFVPEYGEEAKMLLAICRAPKKI